MLRDCAEQEAVDLGRVPSDPDNYESWEAQRSAAVESLAMLANWSAGLLADAANGLGRRLDPLAQALLYDAAAACPLSFHDPWED